MVGADFKLHPKLEQDCIGVGRFSLCRVLLMDDSQYPWLILVPEIADVREIYQLDKAQRTLLNEESCYLAERMAQIFQADKMNIAAIGNIVPQLHVHHVARFCHDVAWPAPIWGKFAAIPYSQGQLADRLAILRTGLPLLRPI